MNGVPSRPITLKPLSIITIVTDDVGTQVDRPTSDSQLLKVVLGRSPMRPASAAEGCDNDDEDPPWHIGEMRPRGYSAPSSKHSSRANNGFMQLRVVETARSSKPPPVSHALRKVRIPLLFWPVASLGLVSPGAAN